MGATIQNALQRLWRAFCMVAVIQWNDGIDSQQAVPQLYGVYGEHSVWWLPFSGMVEQYQLNSRNGWEPGGWQLYELCCNRLCLV